MLIDEKTILQLRDYLKLKTGKYYFKDIRTSGNNIQLTCPFHKNGQENKPSASIRITEGPNTFIGNFNCFTCKKSMSIDTMVKRILGPLYNEDEVESKFQFKTILAKSEIINQNQHIELFKLPEINNKDNSLEYQLKEYRYYTSYLKDRRINEETANKYDIGYDHYARQITFPIRDIYKNCLAIGRRSIDKKQYYYPFDFVKPLYGRYELSKLIVNLWIVEGPFNLWSLSQWDKQGVALLGTGTRKQLDELLEIKTKNYVLALDPDPAGKNGTKKIIDFLLEHNKYNIYVALIPKGKDVNDLTHEEFKNVEVVNYNNWLRNHYN